MISEEEARSRVLNTIQPLPVRRISLLSALGCFAAEDHFARLPLPNFDNSAMDGYAVVANSCRKGERLLVTGEQPAGPDWQLRISLGEAVRIFTGAPMPAGADAVVMQEDVIRDRDEIVLNVDVEPGEFIRKRGCDLSEGQKILSKGERIRAATLALCASQGFSDLAVGAEVSVAIVSTGDELVKVGEQLKSGQVYESNSALLKMMGATNLDLPGVPAKLIADLKNYSDRPHYVRGKLEGGKFTPVGRQESHALFGLSQSNALLRVAVGESFKADELVDVQIWD